MTTTISACRRVVALGMLGLLLCMAAEGRAVALASDPEDGRIANLRWRIHRDVIVLTYDLLGSPERTYDVRLRVLLQHDSSFSAVPVSVEGDLGRGQAAGLGKEIRWAHRRDFPMGFPGDDYRFEVALPVVEQPSYKLYYIIGGSALAAVGVIALVAGQGQGGQPPPADLPFPPARP